ncbi:MAG: site-2 protease family protein [Thermoplasmata archaeon]|nr:MAG: site-2 protease family protein [Thermoplasmata archaeon]
MRGDEEVVTYRVSYQPYEYYIEPPVREGGLKFSEEEKKHLLMAIGALTLAFTFMLLGTGIPIYTIVGLSFVAVITGFLLHEIGHKIVAQRYGCWAEFRAWPFGLMFAVLTAAVARILFAAPGAVYIRGHLTKEENGKVSAAGPLMNVAVSSLLMPILLFFPDIIIEIWYLIYMICFLNVFIGLFNLIPFPPLDGSKIIKWNPGIWFVMGLVLGSYLILILYPSLLFNLL